MSKPTGLLKISWLTLELSGGGGTTPDACLRHRAATRRCPPVRFSALFGVLDTSLGDLPLDDVLAGWNPFVHIVTEVSGHLLQQVAEVQQLFLCKSNSRMSL
jgi:hypothetical protein